MALRRHLSQEKLVQQMPNSLMSSKTIGDLVNGEIERTLEISNQSIINAAVNMSTLISGPGNVAAAAAAAAAAANNNHTVINTNIQRPERVSVRILEENAAQYAAVAAAQNSAYSPVSRPNSRDLVKSPINPHGSSNLATLAHVATYSQQKYVPGREVPSSSGAAASGGAKLISPRTQQYNSNTTVVYQPRTDSRNGPQYARDERYMPLPRAEMKPYLESYFNEDHKPHHLTGAVQRDQHNIDRRMRDDEKPLEGKTLDSFSCC